jgi:glyoxylase-like metal-dependent hydrolase (beta-lactamase superfamily II)
MEQTVVHPDVSAFFDDATKTVTYLVADPASDAAAIVDPVLDFDATSGRTATTAADKLVAAVRERGLRPEWLLETHVHADHLSGSAYLQQRIGGRIGIGEHVQQVQEAFRRLFDLDAPFVAEGRVFDHLFADGETLQIGGLRGEVMHTPGHTPACITYLVGDAAFVGDTLFMPDYGTARADFPGGDARTLYRSIRRILALPPQTRLFTCHDYKAPGRDQYAWESTVAEQRAANVHVHEGVDEDSFVALRQGRDATLSLPTLIIPSVQVNIRGGRLPSAEPNGISYLKIPINQL